MQILFVPIVCHGEFFWLRVKDLSTTSSVNGSYDKQARKLAWVMEGLSLCAPCSFCCQSWNYQILYQASSMLSPHGARVVLLLRQVAEIGSIHKKPNPIQNPMCMSRLDYLLLVSFFLLFLFFFPSSCVTLDKLKYGNTSFLSGIKWNKPQLSAQK